MYNERNGIWSELVLIFRRQLEIVNNAKVMKWLTSHCSEWLLAWYPNDHHTTYRWTIFLERYVERIHAANGSAWQAAPLNPQNKNT